MTIRANLKRHNRVYMLLSKHTYRPMRALVVAHSAAILSNMLFKFFLLYAIRFTEHTQNFEGHISRGGALA